MASDITGTTGNEDVFHGNRRFGESGLFPNYTSYLGSLRPVSKPAFFNLRGQTQFVSKAVSVRAGVDAIQMGISLTGEMALSEVVVP